MGIMIRWETDLDAAVSKAQAAKKPILLDFFNPG
jgi:hypothetical protein